MPTTTIRQGFNGQIATKSAENVTAYAWWVHDPANGGYPATDDAAVADWPETELEWPTPPGADTPVAAAAAPAVAEEPAPAPQKAAPKK